MPYTVAAERGCMTDEPLPNGRSGQDRGAIDRFLASPSEQSFEELFQAFTPQLVAEIPSDNATARALFAACGWREERSYVDLVSSVPVVYADCVSALAVILTVNLAVILAYSESVW